MARGPEIRLSAGWVVTAMAAVGGEIVLGDAEREFAGVSIDTRTIAPGELFIAIRGERFDGGDFARVALDAGAGGVVVPRGRGAALVDVSQGMSPGMSLGMSPGMSPVVSGFSRTSGSAAVIEVDDTTTALQVLAHAVREASGARVVAITGSAGKTTTKEVTAEFLGARFDVIRNRGNLNNHIGLPLSLMELRQRPEMAVVELGMNHTGEIRTLVRVADPDVRVWTNVGEAHLGFFSSLDAIADAKAEIFEGASAPTLLVANADDARIVARILKFAGRVVTFGIDRHADVRATAVVDRGIDGTRAHVTTPHGEFELTTPLVGRGNLANVLAATAVAAEFGVPLPAIAKRAALLTPAAHRGEVIQLANGVTVIDDSYNANPAATKCALDVLGHTKSGRRVAVLGEMLELGEHARPWHEDVGRAVASHAIDVLLTVGGEAAAAMADAAIAAGLDRANVRHFATSDLAAAAAVDLVRAGDVVLVKGSRGVKTDRVVDRLKAEQG